MKIQIKLFIQLLKKSYISIEYNYFIIKREGIT